MPLKPKAAALAAKGDCARFNLKGRAAGGKPVRHFTRFTINLAAIPTGQTLIRLPFADSRVITKASHQKARLERPAPVSNRDGVGMDGRR